MMPEHINMLNDMYEELDRKEKPVLDDQQKNEFGMMLQLAIKDGLTIEIKYFHNHDYHTTKDKITMIDSVDGYLRLEKMDKLYLNDIIDVEIL